MILRFKKGFSLIELLVVIAIIGILAAVGITAYSGYTTGAKEKAALAQHSQVVKFINTEFVKCAGGSGNYVWTTMSEGGGVVVRITEEELVELTPTFEFLKITPDMPEYDQYVTNLRAYDPERFPVPEAAAPVPAAVPCTNFPVGTDIVNYVNTTLGMTNPYDVTTAFAEAGDENGNASEIGRALIFCDDTDGDCQIRTQYKDNTYEETNIQPY